VSKMHSRSCTVSEGKTFAIVLPNGGGTVVAHGGETILVVVAHSYEKAHREFLDAFAALHKPEHDDAG
jgi:hypothetical protein